MKIAFIAESKSLTDNIKNIINEKKKEKGWNIDYYNYNEDLIKSKFNPYDVVLIDQGVREKKRGLPKTLLDQKTDIAVMNGNTRLDADKDLIFNNQINAIINRKNPEDLIKWLDYVTIKHRINSRLKENTDVYSEIVSNSNGCVFEIKDGVSLLGISRLLSKERIDAITKSIKSSNNKMVVYFTEDVKEITSRYFELIMIFWKKIVHQHKGRMAFWKQNRDNNVIDLAKKYSITKLFPCFEELEDAIQYVKEIEFNKE